MKKELKKLDVAKLDHVHRIIGGLQELSEIDPCCQVCGLGGPVLTGGGHE